MRALLATVLAIALMTAVAPGAFASIAPTNLVATLQPGQSVSEAKVVSVPEAPPKIDVVFAFDLTGSMGGIISTAKARACEIMDTLETDPNIDYDFGCMSYMDYPQSYSSYGYSAMYGFLPAGDYAYTLDSPITSDCDAVTAAINALSLGSGADGPQDYTRIMYESYADENVAWRVGAKRILVNFGDNVPHDDNVNEGVSGMPWSTGGDPGRDEIILNDDDLDLQTVLGEMVASGVTLIECHSGGYKSHWDYWTGLTGGAAYLTTAGTLVEDVIAAVEAEATDPIVPDLHLDVSSGYEAWLTSCVPASYTGPTGVDVPFDITLTVPAGTQPGIYEFAIEAIDAYGVSYGAQDVMVVVYDPAGGFVTGGGWIDSPAGAYVADASLAGKATFGFVSKYQKGASVPTGSTTFVFHVASMTFKSTSYDWLVIAAAKAQYKGTGTIDGAGEYGFMLTATDGDRLGGGATDMFRIKIWDKSTNAIVYDNQLGAADGADPATALSGGSIVIHKK